MILLAAYSGSKKPTSDNPRASVFCVSFDESQTEGAVYREILSGWYGTDLVSTYNSNGRMPYAEPRYLLRPIPAGTAVNMLRLVHCSEHDPEALVQEDGSLLLSSEMQEHVLLISHNQWMARTLERTEQRERLRSLLGFERV